MADDAGSIPAGSSEDTPSENLIASEALSELEENLPSSPPSPGSTSLSNHIPVSEEKNEVEESIFSIDSNTVNHDYDNLSDSEDISRLQETEKTCGQECEDRLSSTLPEEVANSQSSSNDSNAECSKSDTSAVEETSKLANDVVSLQDSDIIINESILQSSIDNTLPPKEESPQKSQRVLYSGYKKKEMHSKNFKTERRIIPKRNPFSPSWKKESNIIEVVEESDKIADLSSSSTSNFQDCTHYLGLQPSINFRCNHCGLSGFESIQQLNLHQGECRKVLGHSTSTNIKITRKVYLCSACGTYYESWHLFYHMRKVHDKFMCLYCLAMFTYSEKLCEHLSTKHHVNFINFSDLESFKKCNLSSYLFLCLECDNVMSDTDNFKHTCSSTQRGLAKIIPKQVSQVASAGENPLEMPENIQDSNDSLKPLNDPVTNDSFADDPSDFCHIDMNSPRKDLSVPQVESNEPTKPPAQEKPEKEHKEVTKVNSVLSEFPKIDLQPPKMRDTNANRGSDKTSDHEGSKSTDEELKMSDSFTSEYKSGSKNSIKIKAVKRQRMNSRRIPKRPKLDPEKQKSALEKLTETIDAVAKNYRVEPSPPPSSPSNVPPIKLDEDLVKNAELPLSNHEPPRENNIFKDKKPENFSIKPCVEASKDETTTNGIADKSIWKSVPDKALSKFKLHTEPESDEESDDSNKLSMVIDETPGQSDNDSRAAKLSTKGVVSTSDDSNQAGDSLYDATSSVPDEPIKFKPKQDEITLAGEDIPSMALTLDDKVENVKVEHILKECVRTSCTVCNYCRRAIKIAVNGKYLALHILSEHRFTPTKNDSPEDVINKLKSSLEQLSSVYFNTESYDSSDPSIHVPYDKDNTFDCFQCSFVTYSHKDLHIHKRKSHTKSLLLCIMCKINFYSYSELLCHLCPGHYNPDYQFNNIDINFRCCFCRLDTIPSAFRLMVHLRKCHHTCDICLEVCSDQQKLSTHMWKHKLNHLCYRCGIAYVSKLDITKHLFWKHGTESVLCKKCLQKKWPHVYHFCIPPTSFLCEECDSTFSKAVALKVHKRIHAGDFSYHCTQCEKKFVSKKLLQKHEDQHNNPIEPTEQEDKGKEEIIDVTGESNGNNDGGLEEIQEGIPDTQKGSDKENENSKHHKKHKKEKKTKQVVDVYDLPPLNLSSDSDSSDDESTKNPITEPEKEAKDRFTDIADNVKEIVNCSSSKETDEISCVKIADTISDQNDLPVNQVAVDHEKTNSKMETDNSDEEMFDCSHTKPLEQQCKAPEEAVENTSIWENFYKTNSNNKNLPYPLCAMKSEDAYKIIMGDHDYCLQMKTSDPVIKEDILQSNLECDKIDVVGSTAKPDLNETTASESSPIKKKQKSPKKKTNNNSSSSSDSSSDSDSSSCSCGENCSCSSSSSDSSSSSSSDSDSSGSETGNKPRGEKRKKKKEKKSKIKTLNVDQNSENKTIIESVTPTVPEEPAIRESDLETEESSTDEEFYDRQPQKLSNQLLAEKRNQLMLLASVAPVHGEGLGHELTKSTTLNETFSDPSGTAPSTPDLNQHPPKKVSKSRRKKSFIMKSRKRISKNYSFNNVSQSPDAAHKSPKPYILKVKEPKRIEKPSFGALTPPTLIRNVLSSETNSGGGSESDSVRASKRKRIPNKFYGYSSGEEEEKLQQMKWKKPEVSTPPPPPPSIVTTPKFVQSAPQTPRIQLSVPKQVIRKNHSDPSKVRHYLSGNDSTDSNSDNDKRFLQQPAAQPQLPAPQLLPSPPTNKEDKNLYCYCRCPYDEISEMIACDDKNCKIEWFHFECVGISVPPKGQWFCPQCSRKRGILP